jgi:hypothetical protein
MKCLLPIVLLAACSDSSSTSTVDAPGAMADAYDTAQCLIQGDYGDAGALTGTAGSAQGATTVTVTLDAGPPRDTFFIRMVPGNGAFTGGVAPGTYTISGADADYNTCGLCVHIIADIVSGQGPTKFYFADSGTVTLTATTPPISGSVQNLHFNEIDIGSGAPVSGGCQASMTSASFTAP